MKPTICRIVIYRKPAAMPKGKILLDIPFLISGVNEDGTVNGWEFGDWDPKETVAPSVQYHRNIRHGEGPDQWMWPVKDK